MLFALPTGATKGLAGYHLRSLHAPWPWPPQYCCRLQSGGDFHGKTEHCAQTMAFHAAQGERAPRSRNSGHGQDLDPQLPSLALLKTPSSNCHHGFFFFLKENTNCHHKDRLITELFPGGPSRAVSDSCAPITCRAAGPVQGGEGSPPN